MNKQLPRRPTRFVKRVFMDNKRKIKQLHRRQLNFVQRYIDELAIYLSEKKTYRLKVIGQFLGIVLLCALLGFIFLGNSAPFGVTIQYALRQDTKSISKLGPKDRIQQVMFNGQQVSKINEDLVYFSTAMPFQFDIATVKVYFQNLNPDQTFSLGFHDESTYHYDAKPFDIPFLNKLSWSKTGMVPVLYQRTPKYISVDTFLNNPPVNEIIGTFNYNSGIGDISQTNLISYSPQNSITTINTPLRGKQTFYVYLDKEPFHMKIYKQDLNWYNGSDPVTVSVYKDNALVLQQSADDDGITDNSQKTTVPQEIDVNNPGPGLPESGVYKVIIDANDDILITGIRTNLHKIVFDGSSLFLAGSDVYKPAVATASASTVYTNALSLNVLTYHSSGEQTIFVDNQPYNLDVMKIPLIITPPNTLSKIVVPKNDVVLSAFQGYFAFSPDQFFMPTQYHVLPITKPDDVSLVDYIITEYQPSHQEAGWQTNTQTFDLSSAYIQNNKLNWVIQAPKLKENGNTLIIKDIQVTFHKKGWNNT